MPKLSLPLLLCSIGYLSLLQISDGFGRSPQSCVKSRDYTIHPSSSRTNLNDLASIQRRISKSKVQMSSNGATSSTESTNMPGEKICPYNGASSSSSTRSNSEGVDEFDVLVLGGGVAGLTLASLLQGQEGLRVCLADPGATTPATPTWYPNYGEWTDEWETLSARLGLPELLECTTNNWEYTGDPRYLGLQSNPKHTFNSLSFFSVHVQSLFRVLKLFPSLASSHSFFFHAKTAFLEEALIWLTTSAPASLGVMSVWIRSRCSYFSAASSTKPAEQPCPLGWTLNC
jgi:hypothetical protein